MWDVRAIGATEVEDFRDRISRGFGHDPDRDETARERFHAVFDLDRTFAAFDGDEIVGTGAAYPLGVTVPGGAEVAMAGTTIITVQPTYRRRGALRAMMDWHLDDVAARGEPLAGLWASEATIYRRFGYAPATFRHRAAIDARSIAVPSAEDGGLEVGFVDATEAAPVVRGMYEAVRPSRAGMLTRSDAWWDHRLLADPEAWRGGKSALRYLTVADSGSVVGYATYRQKDVWDDFRASGEVHVTEIITATPGARNAVWRFLTNVDLFPTVEWWNMPIDDSLPALATDSRAVRRTLADALWVRVLDVEAALEARRYEQDGEIVIAVTDEVRPEVSGVYHLTVEGGHAGCARVGSATPEVTFDIDVLGHLYLGGGNALTMADAGRIEGDGEAVTSLDGLFRTGVAPWCPEVF